MQDREPGEIARLEPESPEIEQAIVDLLSDSATEDAQQDDEG